MAICQECNREIARCGDCGVALGGFHHLGCDLEHCPSCRRHLLSCGCPFDELGGKEDEDVGDGGDIEDDSDIGDVGDDELRADRDAYGYAVCPRCGSDSVVPIFYGRPNAAMESLSQRGLVELAGRAFSGAQPSTRCRDCEHAWSRRAG